MLDQPVRVSQLRAALIKLRHRLDDALAPHPRDGAIDLAHVAPQGLGKLALGKTAFALVLGVARDELVNALVHERVPVAFSAIDTGK